MNRERYWGSLLYFLLLISIALIFSCKKDFDRQAAVITRSVDLPTANAKATVIDLGRGTITDHGFCWDSMNNPTFEKSRLTLGGLAFTGDYQGQLTGLLPKKTYYLRAFVAFGENLEYGDQITFTTPDLPSLTTSIITNITDTAAKSGGDISSDGGAPVIARGVCWSTANNPDLTNNHSVDSIGKGVFISHLFGLNAGNLYYVRAYATNLYGTQYGNELGFTSGQGQTAPVVTSKEVTSITQTTAACGGNVVSDGGSPVTARGVCWSASPYPTTDNSKTSDGTGTGEFTSSLTALTANKTYYVRAYATNQKGTSYGDEKSFQTLSAPNLPTVTTATVTNITQTTATSGGTVLTEVVLR